MRDGVEPNDPYFPFLKIFFSAFFGSGPVTQSGGAGRTGGGGPGGFGTQGGFGIFMPRFLSLGACCRAFFAIRTSLSTSQHPTTYLKAWVHKATHQRTPMELAKIHGFSRKKTSPTRAE